MGGGTGGGNLHLLFTELQTRQTPLRHRLREVLQQLGYRGAGRRLNAVAATHDGTSTYMEI